MNLATKINVLKISYYSKWYAKNRCSTDCTAAYRTELISCLMKGQGSSELGLEVRKKGKIENLLLF